MLQFDSRASQILKALCFLTYNYDPTLTVLDMHATNIVFDSNLIHLHLKISCFLVRSISAV